MQMHSPVCVYILVCGCPDAGVCVHSMPQLMMLFGQITRGGTR